MIEIFGSRASRTRRCLWTAEECGEQYKLHHLERADGDLQAPEFLAINPNGRMPAMRDGDLLLFESAAICLYIAKRHPESGLIPDQGTAEAALFDQWMFWITTELEQALWSMGKHRFALPEEWRIEAMEATAHFEFSRATPILAKALKGRDFLVGDHFTLVDIMAAHTLAWARNFKAEFGSDDLERYLDLHKERPSFKATFE